MQHKKFDCSVMTKTSIFFQSCSLSRKCKQVYQVYPVRNVLFSRKIAFFLIPIQSHKTHRLYPDSYLIIQSNGQCFLFVLM